jgi:DinB superfamily
MITQKLNTKKLFAALDNASSELLEMVESLNETEFNTVPFTGSWTAAQLASHITKSNNSIAQALDMEAKKTERNPDERAQELKEIFLDFKTKFQSPEFIVPAQGIYEKETVIGKLKKSIERLKEQRNKVNLSQILSLPAFGEITKLELLYFVLYHTQRHIHQLKNILRIVNKK